MRAAGWQGVGVAVVGAAYTASLVPSLTDADGGSGAVALAAVAAAWALAALAVVRGGPRKLVWAAPLAATAIPGWTGVPGVAFAAGLLAVVLLALDLWGAGLRRAAERHGPRLEALVLPHAALVLFVVAFVAFYGQLDRKQSGDTYAIMYTSVSIVHDGTIRLDRYLPFIQQRAGEHPYQITEGDNGHVYARPLAPVGTALVAAPAVAVASALGAHPSSFGTWMSASRVSGALVAAGAVALLFVALTRLTTRRRAFALAAVFGFGTFVWSISGQGLWQQTPSLLALTGALLALFDRRWTAAGFALGAMVAIRPSTLLIALLLTPLLGRRPRALGSAALGALPPLLALAAFNRGAYGCAYCFSERSPDPLKGSHGFGGSILEGVSGNLVSPGRGIFVLAPVLVFAVAGAVLGFRRPVYRWAAIATAAHVLLTGHWVFWWGGEVFGPRQLVDVLPLLTLLLVPAVTRWGGSPRFRTAFAVLAAWSVAVQFLGAALWPGTGWYGRHDPAAFGTWWDPTDTDVTAFFANPARVVERAAIQLLVVAAALLAGLAAARIAQRVPRPKLVRRRPAQAAARARLLALLPWAAVLVALPALLHDDLVAGDPWGGFAVAVAAGALAVAPWRERTTRSGLPLLALPLIAFTDAPTGWAMVAALASLAIATAERLPTVAHEAPVPAAQSATG